MYPIENIWPNWKVVRLIGKGSFGRVYEIVRNYYGVEEHSALKVISIPNSDSELQSLRNSGMSDNEITEYYRGLIDDFTQEIVLMHQLKGQSSIVSYEDFAVVNHQGKIGWDILIRMELLISLAPTINSRSFSQSEIIELGISLCDALSVCHKNSIIHRDIKPDNIFLTKNGQYKLGDFGVARTVEKTTSEMSKKGTYSYMAPEVYRGENYGSSVDIYSLGMVMHRLLNFNREPFAPLPPTAITYKDKEEALIKRMTGSPLLKPANASESLSRIILKACAFKPGDRFLSAYEMKSELVRLKNDPHYMPVYGQNAQYDNFDRTRSVNQYNNNIPPVGGVNNLHNEPPNKYGDGFTNFNPNNQKPAKPKRSKAPLIVLICLIAVIGIGTVTGIILLSKQYDSSYSSGSSYSRSQYSGISRSSNSYYSGNSSSYSSRISSSSSNRNYSSEISYAEGSRYEYDKVFSDNGIYLYNNYFASLDDSHFVKKDSESELIESLEFGYKDDIVQEMTDTIYYVKTDMTDSEIDAVKGVLEETCDNYRRLNFCTVESKEFSSYLKYTIKMTDMDDPDNISEIINLGIVSGNNIDYISMKETEDSLLNEGFVKR